MAVRVAGCWEVGFNYPAKEVDEWETMLKEFGVGRLVMSPVSGIRTGLTQEFLAEKQSLEDAITEALNDGLTLVFVDERAEDTLENFEHPANACYIFGRTGLSPHTAYFNAERGDKAVKIPTVANQGGFWSHQAAAILFYDRHMKTQEP